MATEEEVATTTAATAAKDSFVAVAVDDMANTF
jgi:hypothetical protein